MLTTTGTGAVMSRELPLDKYYLVEVEAPEGYVTEHTRYKAAPLFADNETAIVETSVTVHNEYLPAEITLRKEKEAMRQAENKGGTIREVLAPERYALHMEEFAFAADAEGNVTGDTTIRDDYTRVTLKKQDEGGKPLAGVVFGLLDENGTQVEVLVDGFFVNLAKPIGTIVNQPIIDHYYAFVKTDHEDNLLSGDGGVVHVNGLALGTYTIRKTEALEDFTVSEESSTPCPQKWRARKTTRISRRVRKW